MKKCITDHDLVDLNCKEKSHNLPKMHALGVNLSMFAPSFFLEKITNNICGDWVNGGQDKILPYIRDWKIAWKDSKKCYDLKTDEECAKQFTNKNEFFQRELHPSKIVIDDKEKNNVLVSPADCRMVAFTNVDDSTTYWIKGENFTKEKLLDNKKISKEFNGPVIVCRLAPDDYHRFHFPVDCTFLKSYKVKGKYNSVDRRIVNSCIDPFGENKREVFILHSKIFGYIAHVVIGATCVGSIQTELIRNKKYKKGDLFGMFGFGGSSIVMLFSKNLYINPLILDNSKNSIETYVRVGNRIGEISEPTIIFLHGGPGMPDYMKGFFEHKFQGIKTIFYTQEGRTTEELLKELDKVVKKQKSDRVYLCGHSWGGVLALMYAKLHSEKISGIICISSLYSSKNRRNQKPNIEDYLSQSERQESRHKRYVKKLIDKVNIDVILNVGKTLIDFDLTEFVQTTNIPILNIYGDKDNIILENTFNKVNSNIKNIVIKEAGHFPFLNTKDRDRVVKNIKEFI
jgi:phosphatidylserine decarboxylase precursor